MTATLESTQMKAAVMSGAYHIELVQLKKPVPKANEVLIKVGANSICGSDLHYWHEGKIGSAVVSGAFTPGHEFAGWIAEDSGLEHGLPDGTLVAVDPAQPCHRCEWCHRGNHNLCPNMIFVGGPPYAGAMAEYITVPISTVFPLPEGFTAQQGALLEPLGVAIHALDLAKLRPGADVAVLGAGPIGLYIALLARMSGAMRVCILEPQEYRRDKALELGIDHAFAGVAEYREFTEGRGADVVLEATTSPHGPRHATEAARIGGKVVLVGIPDGDEFSLTGSLIRRKGLTIKLSRRMGHIYARAIEYVRSGRIDVDAIVTHSIALENVREAFEMLADYRDGAIKVVLVP